MRVGVLAPAPVAPVVGGFQRAVTGLVAAIDGLTPHAAELVEVSVAEASLPDVVDAYDAFRHLDVGRFDLVVSTKYPSWMIEHDRHVAYVFHPLRGLYDTYWRYRLPARVDHLEPDLRALQRLVRRRPDRAGLDEVLGRWREVLAGRGAHDPALRFPGPLARELVHHLDGVGLAPGAVRRHLAISRTVASRTGYFPPGVEADWAHLPGVLPGSRSGAADHVFTTSRLEGPKRLDLVLAAYRRVPGGRPLLVAGTGPDAGDLAAMAAAGGDDRVRFLGHVEEAALVDLYADAALVPFVPRDEDLGLVALEAMGCATPVVTAADSGGVTELVVDGLTGLVAEPSPGALAAAMTDLLGDPARSARFGAAGRRRAEAVTWDGVVAALLAPLATATVSRRVEAVAASQGSGRRRLVVTSTFTVHPARHGGQLRCAALSRALAEDFDVTIVSLGGVAEAASRTEVAPGLVEVVVPKSAEHEAEELRRTAAVGGLPVTDIVAGALIGRTPAYLAALADAVSGAAVVLEAQPYLHPAVVEVGGAPVVYDAYNAEVVLKDGMLPATAAGDRLRAAVREVEGAAVRAAALVPTCSPEDAAALQAAYGVGPGRFVDVPNGADVNGTPFVTGPARARGRDVWLRRFVAEVGVRAAVSRLAVFLGSWHQPNLDAADEVLALAPNLPSTLFVLAGTACAAYVDRPLPANVALAGVVSEAAKRVVLGCADVALNPMLSGSGTNLKVVEYLAAGAPVVTTPFGARGLPPGEEAYVVEAPVSGFPAAIEAVLADPAAAGARARVGRAVVEGAYDWVAVGRRLRAAVEAAVA